MAAEDDVIKVLGNYHSPFVLRARISLNIKNVKYEYIEENLMNKSERLLKANPIHQKIPVLVHGEKPICESLIIVQYIDEVWSLTGPAILPADPHDRAVARFWAAYIDDKLYPTFRELRTARRGEATAVVVNKMVEVLLLLEDVFVKCSQGSPYFGGESVGFLDIALCGLPWFNVVERMTNMKVLDETKMPNLAAWANKFSQHPAVKDVLPDVDKLMEFYRKMMPNEEVAPN